MGHFSEPLHHSSSFYSIIIYISKESRKSIAPSNRNNYIHVTIWQRTTLTKPRPLRMCGGYWTSWPALWGLPSPDEARQHRIPGPRRVGLSRPRVTLAHPHRPMDWPDRRRRRRRHQIPLFLRTTSGWSPSTQRRSSPTSTSSSRSLTSLLLYYVSILFFVLFGL